MRKLSVSRCWWIAIQCLFIALIAGSELRQREVSALVSIVNDAPQHNGGVYVGPGDIVASAYGWYGLRCYAAANASGAQAIRIRRASDNAESDIGLTATCNLDVATATTFCNATSCFVKTWYEQSGGGAPNISQTTTANQAALTFNCINTSKPCVTFGGTPVIYNGAVVLAKLQPYSLSAVAITTTTGVEQYIFSFYDGAGAGILSFEEGGTAGNNRLYCGGDSNKSATDNQWHAMNGVCNGSSSVLNVDGTDGSNGTGASASGLLVGIGGDASVGANYLTGSITEVGMWPSGFSSGNRTSMCHNQFAYWATATSC